MNINTESAECLDGMCSACKYEDCACDCHFPECEFCLDDDSICGGCFRCVNCEGCDCEQCQTNEEE